MSAQKSMAAELVDAAAAPLKRSPAEMSLKREAMLSPAESSRPDNARERKAAKRESKAQHAKEDAAEARLSPTTDDAKPKVELGEGALAGGHLLRVIEVFGGGEDPFGHDDVGERVAAIEAEVTLTVRPPPPRVLRHHSQYIPLGS